MIGHVSRVHVHPLPDESAPSLLVRAASLLSPSPSSVVAELLGRNTALRHYLALRRARPDAGSDALFVATRSPYGRVTRIRKDIHRALQLADISGSGVTPVKLRRALLATIVNEGPGWSVGRAFGYRSIRRGKTRYLDVRDLSNLLERHHPMGRSSS